MNETLRDQSPKQLLELLAGVKKLMQDRAVELRRLPGVENAEASLEPTSYLSGPILEGYLEVKFDLGEAVCWCIDVRWDQDSWTIEGTLDRLSSGCQRTLRELAVESAKDFPEFVEVLKRIVPELLALNLPEMDADPLSGWPGRVQGRAAHPKFLKS